MPRGLRLERQHAPRHGEPLQEGHPAGAEPAGRHAHRRRENSVRPDGGDDDEASEGVPTDHTTADPLRQPAQGRKLVIQSVL